MIGLVIAASMSLHAKVAGPLLRPPNGTYVYSMNDGSGKTIFKSTIVVIGSRSTFDISEKTRLPNGAIAKTRSTWSSTTLLPISFEVQQGNVALHAQITPEAMKFVHPRVTFARIQGTSYVIPSVGLIANSLMLPYVVTAHPGQSFTLAEIQNNQTVLIRPGNTPSSPVGPAGDLTVSVTKDKEHGNSADEERIVAWLNRKSGIMDGGRAFPGAAKIKLLSFVPSSP